MAHNALNDLVVGHVPAKLHLPDFSVHRQLRTFHFHGITPTPEVECSDGSGGGRTILGLSKREQLTWKALVAMFKALVTTRVLSLHMEGSAFRDIEKGSLRDYSWDHLGHELSKNHGLRQIFLLFNIATDSPAFPDHNPWFDQAETMSHIVQSLPSRVQRMFNFGVFYRDFDVVYTPA